MVESSSRFVTDAALLNISRLRTALAIPTVLGSTQSRNIVSCKTGTPVYIKDYIKQEDIMRIILVFACAALAGCVQTAHLSEVLSGGGVERVEGRYRTEQVVNPLRGG